MTLRFLDTLHTTDLDGARVIVRIDTNIPIGDDGIVDPYEAYRIDVILPTLTWLLKRGARLILMGHHGGNNDTQTLKPIADYLDDKGFTCHFIPGKIRADLKLDSYPITLFDNLRLHPEEKTNGYDFGCLLSSYGDIYVNEAFSSSHRPHASIVGIPEHIPGYLGLEHAQEIERLAHIRTLTTGLGVIVAGSKFETKIDLIRKFLERGTPVFLGGALAHAVYRARGYTIGNSFIDETVDVTDIAHNPLLLVPDWVIVLCSDGTVQEKKITDIHTDDIIVDMGEQARDQLSHFISPLSTLLWNGPFGWYEKGYIQGTLLCANEVQNYSLTSILGGGDTVSLLNKEHLLSQFSFVSTGGGAMLDFLLMGTLPGIDALTE